MDIADHIRRDPEEGARRLVSELGPGLYGVALRLVGNDRAAADDLAVWRGAFVSVAAASLSYGYWPETPAETERSRAAAVGWEGGVPFAQGLLVDVFADRIEIQARDFARDHPLGDSWVLPTPSTAL